MRPLSRALPALGVALALLGALALGLAQARTQEPTPRPMPEFGDRSPEAWINAAPLSRADLGGKVVLIEVWNTT